jgi:hypothetical protein
MWGLGPALRKQIFKKKKNNKMKQNHENRKRRLQLRAFAVLRLCGFTLSRFRIPELKYLQRNANTKNGLWRSLEL